jgi:GT2 family glycosyltransferase
MIKVGVIIPFYGGAAYLPKLLDSIFADSEGYNLIVYIIDNSRAEDRLNIKEIQDYKAILINAAVGLGYGKACNIGFRKSLEEQNDITVIVNQDGYFSKGSLKKMVDELMNNNAYCISMPLITEYGSLSVEPFFTQVYLTPLKNLITDLFAGTVKNFYNAEILCGACFALKMAAYKFSYLFDPVFYMYYEDADLGRRLKQNGNLIMFLPAAVFHHLHSNTDPAKQKFKNLLVKRISRHKYILKDSARGFLRNIINWGVLEIRNIIQLLLQFHFKDFIIEIFSAISVFFSLRSLFISRRTDLRIRQNKNL